MNRLAVITSLLLMWGLVFSKASAHSENTIKVEVNKVQKLSNK